MRSWYLSAFALLASSQFVSSPVMATGVETNVSAPPRFVAGLQPYQRPVGAPVISAFAPDRAWQERALHGVELPGTLSLKFLKDQGAWYNPFIYPGMPSYYDLRKWHVQSGALKKESR